MYTSQTQFLNEVAAGHDGPVIPASKRAYFQERFRGRVFDFLLELFLREKDKGLTQAKLARRIGKSPEVVNRWLGSPTNLRLDSISDLLIGIAGEELVPQSRSVLEQASKSRLGLDNKLGRHENAVVECKKEQKPASAKEASKLPRKSFFDSGGLIPQKPEGRLAA